MEAALKTFFSSARFAVAGASSDTSKYGHKVFVWYLTHSLPATPLNPRAPSITVGAKSYDTVASPSALVDAQNTSLSIITPPAVTMALLKEAKEAGVPAVWLQPGSFDAEIIEYARKEFKAAIAGMDGGTWGDEGWCVLVDGERGLKTAHRHWERANI
ncbi:NAD(P)-binding protein [Eremomyces bilateralis CBS 781.70]|uniref:NAD(P)-binding protein n=1 Tax=Eremomyces bilateralis CBS 781.70 TaxID=1392243 RepID=A0A6G1G5W5_9PEZI|nr:NAD(P)-binding protein [Eremomyces bilateralis CBS 781.70]KAF1813326.1 NAD(P)-binding protein [Eremomyces bilateralis CBS 781.70]